MPAYLEWRENMTLNIIQATSTTNTNYLKNRKVNFLVIHYTAGVTSRKGTARNVCAWFKSPNNTRKASADFVVDDEEIVQYNPDVANRYCNAVGGKKYLNTNPKFYGAANNTNCISIEICSNNRTSKMTVPNDENYYFTNKAVENAVKLAKYLMKEYSIPELRLIRHYDVNGKPCPGVLGWSVGNEDQWLDFKNKVLEEKDLVNINYEGKKIQLRGKNIDNHYYVGIREAAQEIFGKRVDWDSKTREVLIFDK